MNISYASLCVILATLFSCSSLKRINVSMLEPGAVSFPSNVQNLVLLNRAHTPVSKASKIESILTGEGKNQDAQGRQHVLSAIHATMANSPRLKCILSDQEYSGNGTGTIFPPLLGCDTIAKLCKQHNAQAVLALETYDSDCIITHESGNVQVNNQFGIPIPKIQLFVTHSN